MDLYVKNALKGFFFEKMCVMGLAQIQELSRMEENALLVIILFQIVKTVLLFQEKFLANNAKLIIFYKKTAALKLVIKILPQMKTEFVRKFFRL